MCSKVPISCSKVPVSCSKLHISCSKLPISCSKVPISCSKVPILCKFLLRRIRSKDMEVLMPHNLENFETACFFRKEILNNWQEQTAWNNSPDRTGNPFLPDFRLVKKIVGKSGTGLWKENGWWSSLQKSHFSWWNGFLLLISFWT